jgi:diadenosine tetraphosphate (Ap4A) HIT family hydrolase
MTRTRKPFNLDAYIHEIQTKPCFLCEIVAKNPEYAHHIVYEDDIAIAFLNKYPVLYGYTLVAPKEHREEVTGDFSLDEYLELQRVIYRVAEAVRLATEAERVYILSLGSQQGNTHVHWHIAPLPPGIPFSDQQLAALDIDKGILDLSDEEMVDLARRINRSIH